MSSRLLVLWNLRLSILCRDLRLFRAIRPEKPMRTMFRVHSVHLRSPQTRSFGASIAEGSRLCADGISFSSFYTFKPESNVAFEYLSSLAGSLR